MIRCFLPTHNRAKVIRIKTLLIKPPTGGIYKEMKKITPEYPPLGLAYIASFLERADHEVKIIDLSVENYDEIKLMKLIDKFSPAIIGITANTPTADSAYRIVHSLKSAFPDILFIMGGPHPTVLPDEALQYADVVIRGEGEETFLEIADKGFTKKMLMETKGISMRFNGKKIRNPDREFNTDLDSFPLPARHLLPMNKYHYFGARKYPLTNILTSRGCPFQCSYCNKKIFGHKFRARSPEDVLKEIDFLVQVLHIKEIHISDDTFCLDKKRVLEICRLVKERGYDLVFFPHNGFRVDTVDSELLESMKSAGFYAQVFGVESGNQQILMNIRKGITLEQVRTAFRLSKELGFETWGTFILGLMGETKQSAMDTIKFAIELDPDVAKIHILVPYPGTRDYERLKDRMVVKEWADFGMFSGPTFEPENMTRDELYGLFKTAYRKFYFRSAPMLRILKKSIKSPKTILENINAGRSVLKISKGW